MKTRRSDEGVADSYFKELQRSLNRKDSFSGIESLLQSTLIGMKAILVLPAILISLVLPMQALSSATSYSDLEGNHIYAPAILHFTQSGLVNGYDDGSFGTDKAINRVEALKIIMNYWGLENKDAELNFSDTDPNAWYSEYLKGAISAGIVSGYPDGTFKPEQTINRVEALKMILLSGQIEITQNELEESEAENWYVPFLDYAIENYLLEAGPNNDYSPSATLSRGEFLDILYRMDSNPYAGGTEYGVASYYGYSFDGANTASGRALEAYGYMTAHLTLDFGTWIRVTNLANNKYVDVEVVDRGPHIDGRIVDLTPQAFSEIGSLGSGILKVRIEILETK